MTDLGWVNAIVQLTTAGGFGALAWYLVVRHIPEVEKRHREERDAMLSQVASLFERYHATVEREIEVIGRMEVTMEEVSRELRNIRSQNGSTNR